MFWDVLKVIALFIVLFLFIGARNAWDERDAKYGPQSKPATTTTTIK